jgi:hypothetical protein
MKPDKINLILAAIIILAACSWISSCTHKTDLTGLPDICFDDVQQIYTTSCAKPNCHSGGGESDLTFNSYNDIRNTVVPGDPDASQSYKAIITTWGEGKMPPDEPISIDNRTTIRVWIEQGALNLPCPKIVGKSVYMEPEIK